MNTDLERIDALCRHIENVQRNCRLLGEKLIEKGDVVTGKMLIANGLMHDQSKFYGIEWDLLIAKLKPGPEAKMAVQHHARSNPHHPEYWQRIQSMPRVYVAEMVCDWKARASEFGTSLQKWIEESLKRYGYTAKEPVYVQIQEFVELLCDPAFSNLT